jgi:hypothetical protein
VTGFGARRRGDTCLNPPPQIWFYRTLLSIPQVLHWFNTQTDTALAKRSTSVTLSTNVQLLSWISSIWGKKKNRQQSSRATHTHTLDIHTAFAGEKLAKLSQKIPTLTMLDHHSIRILINAGFKAKSTTKEWKQHCLRPTHMQSAAVGEPAYQ